MIQPQYEIVTTSAGAISIRDNQVNEIMHNPVGPWAEANSLYIEQSNLAKRMLDPTSDELVIFDVGLGAGTNAMAILECAKNSTAPISRKIKIISFERQMDLLIFALLHSEEFEYFRKHKPAVESILQSNSWNDEMISWKLRRGDFLDVIEDELERPDIIFFDPYSPKVNKDMWSAACFEKLFRTCKLEAGTLLYTYSQATPIRVALLAAGFFVGQGKGSGLKEETTQAATRLTDLDAPLGSRWLDRWKKSQTPYPYDYPSAEAPALREKILNHSQFQQSRPFVTL